MKDQNFRLFRTPSFTIKILTFHENSADKAFSIRHRFYKITRDKNDAK